MSKKREDIDKKKDIIISMLKSGISKAEVCRYLKCKYITLKSRLDKWGCNIKNTHRKSFPRLNNRKHVSEYLHHDSNINSFKLKKKLWQDGYKAKFCEECGIYKWRGKPAPLELDHTDGYKFNNCIENLKILCANCHAKKSTNGGKNKGTYKISSVSQLAEETRLDRVRCEFEYHRSYNKKSKNKCIDCKKEIKKTSKRCKKCFSLSSRKIEWPPVEKILEILKEENYTKLAKRLGVTDNAIRNYLKRNNK